jgi:hypothetical protein
MKIVAGCTLPLVDVADMYAEKIVTKNNKLFYEYEKNLLPLIEEENNSKLSRKRQTDTQNLYHLLHNHGPIMAKETWIALKSNNRSMKSLEQSWMRTKSKSFEDYKKAMDLKATPQTILYMRTKKEILHTGTEILFQ